MCGFVGFLSKEGISESNFENLKLASNSIEHRGPDDAGIWVDRMQGIALGHQRLSILDLSPNGAQPMVSQSGRFVIAFNGEIYNFTELRGKLEAESETVHWSGHSDTEVLLRAIDVWGVEKTLTKVKGMFAFALWDREEKSLVLARDRMGEKPLYFSETTGAICFGSELKAVLALNPDRNYKIARNSIGECLQYGYIAAPRTVFEGVHKLRAGEYICFKFGVQNESFERKHSVYWDAGNVAHQRRMTRFSGDLQDASRELNKLLVNSIQQQMISDVPLGAFLSGGIDSSVVTAIMQSLKGTQVETFSLGFKELEKDESPFARAVAAHLKTSHNEFVLQGEEAAELIEQMPEIYDEPFLDPSQIPTYLIAKYARQKVTVALSGDGGDELFGGYSRYFAFNSKRNASVFQRVSRVAKRSALLLSKELPLKLADSAGINSFGGRSIEYQHLLLAMKLKRFKTGPIVHSYLRSFSNVDDPSSLVVGYKPTEIYADLTRFEDEQSWSIFDKITLCDIKSYLSENILTKVDRASMASSLECRVPLLDRDVVEFALSLGDQHKIEPNGGKAVLKQVLNRYVPQELWDRPKKGFGIPCTAWLKGPLRDLVDQCLSPEKLANTGVFSPKLTRELWERFLLGDPKISDLVWRVFQLQLYLLNLKKKVAFQ